MKIKARLTAIVERVQAEPVVTAQVVGGLVTLGAWIGLPVTDDIKVGLSGLIVGGATLVGRSKSVPTAVLTQGTVMPSGPGEAVVVMPSDDGPAIVVAEGTSK